jgi:hypothetical protein
MPLCAEQGGDPQVVKLSQQRRYADESLVDQVVELDRQWRQGKPPLPGSFTGDGLWQGCSAVVDPCYKLMGVACASYTAAQYKREQLNKQLNAISRQVAALRKVRTGLHMQSESPCKGSGRSSAVLSTHVHRPSRTAVSCRMRHDRSRPKLNRYDPGV